ncbi:MAG TPA: GNAT family N-acetyltransferase [Acidimicrobiia bacterium]|nr:GNAT family N-acetyltransferase [Acidimicrobiia bacterium]
MTAVHCLELATGGAIRAPHADDAPRLVAMFERCSPATRYGRFLAPVAEFPARHLADIVDPAPGQWSWIVDRDPGAVVGVASLFRTGLRTAAVGLLVEDAAQRHGFGTGLLDLMVATALDVGVTTLEATTLAGSHHVRRMLMRVGTMTVVTRGIEYEVRVSLAGQDW